MRREKKNICRQWMEEKKMKEEKQIRMSASNVS